MNTSVNNQLLDPSLDSELSLDRKPVSVLSDTNGSLGISPETLPNDPIDLEALSNDSDIENDSESNDLNQSRFKVKHMFGIGDRIVLVPNEGFSGTETPLPSGEPKIYTVLLPLPCQGRVISTGTAAGDSIEGKLREDIISGLGGNDTIKGHGCNDTLLGNDGNDDLDGGSGDDWLSGGNGIDKLIGGLGEDTLKGGDQFDQLFGGNGVDLLEGGNGKDFLFGEEDDDLLFGDNGDDFLDGGDGADALSGGDNNDTLLGGGEDDILLGGAGNDVLKGEDGNDELVGGIGDDFLVGSLGDFSVNEVDTLTGNGGRDTFVLNDPKSTGNAYTKSGSLDYALITDFEQGIDTIQVSAPQLGQSSYALATSNNNTVLYFIDGNSNPKFASSVEQIAVVEGVVSLSLNQDFSFV